MIVEECKIYKGFVAVLLLMILFSCTDETIISGNVEGAYISIRNIDSQNTTHSGCEEDYDVNTLRVLAFNKTTGACISNIHYSKNQWIENIIRHPIVAGNYDFVFLANEPTDNVIANKLNTLSRYDDLNLIAYPASSFSSEKSIPMMQEINNVEVLPKGKGAKLSDGTTVSLLQLALNRLGVRVDVVLEAADNLDDIFNGVIFSGIPNLIPLTAQYSGSTIERNVTRNFTLREDGDYFSSVTPNIPGMNWARKITRIILPSNELERKSDPVNAVVFTVDMEDSYNPSCELKINSEPVDYNLPKNTKLDLTGIIKQPLEMNIQASDWDSIANDWNISGNRVLNVSHTEVDITDFNGARISFSSNMPVVRIFDKVKVLSTNTYKETNEVFNALSSQEWQPNADERISYDPSTGAGYMDILLDLPNYIIGKETYEITLMAAEDFSGKNAIRRTITVKVSQYGNRYPFDINSTNHLWSNPYVGAFYKDDESGERIISGNKWSYWYQWRVEVPTEYHDFIVISSTPSFDPNVGTGSPGDPEDYPVIPNSQKGETGSFVQGRGRVYFRIGLKSKNPRKGVPRYGVVKLSYTENGTTYETDLYVRQGEAPDYIMRRGTNEGPDLGVKFSAYNLTARSFLNDVDTKDEWRQIDKSTDQVDFVKYPTQAGAHFQWGLPVAYASLALRAYHPTNVNNKSATWELSEWPIRRIETPTFWDATSGDKLKDYYEICPPGYHRPSDGPLDRIVLNSYTYNDVYKSEIRMSLFRNPMKGDGNWVTAEKPIDPQNKPEKYIPKILEEIKYGFYADGFFDRRPIVERDMIDGIERGSGKVSKYKGVSLDTTEAAYGGVLIFNPDNNASIFFPAAGRRWHTDGSLEYASETGYYWSSSAAPGWTDTSSGEEKGSAHGNIWGIEYNYLATTPKSSSHQFGFTIRCVKE